LDQRRHPDQAKTNVCESGIDQTHAANVARRARRCRRRCDDQARTEVLASALQMIRTYARDRVVWCCLGQNAVLNTMGGGRIIIIMIAIVNNKHSLDIKEGER
jgi:hypothetical protein